MLSGILTPEIIILGGVFACAMAVLTLFLAGRNAFGREQENRLTALETQIDQRQKILSDFGEKLAEHETLLKRVEHMESRQRSLEQDIKPLEEKHLRAMSEYEDAKSKLRSTRDEWSSLAERVELYNERVARLDAIESEVKQLTEQKEELEKIIEGLPEREKEHKRLLKEIEKASDKQSTLNEELKTLEDEKKTLLENSKKLSDEIAASKKKLSDEIAASEKKLSDEIAASEEKLSKLDEELAKRKNKIAKLENTKIDLDARVETLADKLKSVGQMPPEAFDSLKVPVFIPKSEDLRLDMEEKESLEQLYNLVDACGFEIAPRLQNAFHTALKTSDISCLTVMAGVSGTGKSAFPKLYAQAMGMHFLPLAVEPRWDSPHDLFGFLNYMENRFEPTPLGRSLVQFNNSPHDKGSHRAQILLVLLDEMNLARIEHYFSEFLSKLEMRRNASIEREDDYSMVSAEVFAGYPGDKENNIESSPAVRLYAGSNVLFVGTMNEDESTQSLSDKVIDRANVIYFGQPDTLHNIPQHTFDDQDWLPIEDSVWNGWIVDPDNETIPEYEKIDKLINNINGTLGELGRPFGWRTYRAIQSYIANHPEVRFDRNDGMLPFADQIAMRVMPKLRGLDLGDHAELFTRLGVLLNQIDDNALHQAFEKAKNSTQGYFDWRGISWES